MPGMPARSPSDYTSGLSAKSIEDRERGVDISRLCRDLHTLHHPPQLGHDLAGNRDSLLSRAVAPFCRTHPIEQRVRDAHAGDFVGEEFGVARALEWKHAGDDRQLCAFDASHERLETAEIEDRPRDHELRAGVDLVVEATQLLFEVRRGRIDRDADVKRGWRAD